MTRLGAYSSGVLETNFIAARRIPWVTWLTEVGDFTKNEDPPMLGPTSEHGVIEEWAVRNRLLPAEKLPSRVDGEPAELSFVPVTRLSKRDVVLVPWSDFFAKFDTHGLACVFDTDGTGTFEFIQVEQRSPYRRRRYTPQSQRMH